MGVYFCIAVITFWAPFDFFLAVPRMATGKIGTQAELQHRVQLL